MSVPDDWLFGLDNLPYGVCSTPRSERRICTRLGEEVVVSGTDIPRPSGQRKGPGDPNPVFGPSTRLDIEAELGFVVGTGSGLGQGIAADGGRIGFGEARGRIVPGRMDPGR